MTDEPSWLVPFTADRGHRVHPDPVALPRRPRFEKGELALNRFDDPAGQYLVRYVATTLRGCFVETLAHFRIRQAIDARIDAMTNVEREEGDLLDLDGKDPEPSGRVPDEWLSAQRVGRCWIRSGTVFADAVDAWFLTEHDKYPRVRRAIDRHLGTHYDLDAGTILLNLEYGRPVTQAVSATVWDRDLRPGGIRYLSRLDISEECWAAFDHAEVSFDEVEALSCENSEHCAALRSAAALLDLRLPEEWCRGVLVDA